MITEINENDDITRLTLEFKYINNVWLETINIFRNIRDKLI